MSNLYGRQVVLPLTNKSGGGVIAGDVVIIDTANDAAFTTSTAGAVTGGVGIAQETIASNATGRVLIEGYAALVNVNASVTRGNYGKTHTVAKQATDAGASRVAGAFCQFLTGGTTPPARVYPPDLGAAAGNVAADAIWDAAGDLAVGSGADTAAKLSIGAVGGHLSRINGAVAWDSGTSFPGSKATGDRYWRSDLGMTAYWDGTRWLTTEIFELGFSMQDAAVNAGMTAGSINAGRARVPWRGTYSLYILNFEVTVTLPAGTNNGSNYSTFKLNYGDSVDSDTQVGSTLDTSALSASTVTNLSTAVNAVLSANARWLKCRKDNGAGTPGNGIFVVSGLTYRLVLT